MKTTEVETPEVKIGNVLLTEDQIAHLIAAIGSYNGIWAHAMEQDPDCKDHAEKKRADGRKLIDMICPE